MECNKKIPEIQLDLVVIDQDESIIRELTDMGIPALKGDATQDEILISAGIHSAKGLVTSLSSDADNVFTVLSARELNKNLYIVSKAINKNAHEKLKIAGANNTISPDEIGGSRMAALMLNPTIISFLDIITHAGEVVLDLEDVVICDKSSIANMTLREVRIPEKTGLSVLAIKKRKSEKLQFNPSPDETLEIGDTMVVLGRQEQVFELRKLACDEGIRQLKKKL